MAAQWGQVDHFWRTVQEELLEAMFLPSMEVFQGEAEQNILYYDEPRGHQVLEGESLTKIVIELLVLHTNDKP